MSSPLPLAGEAGTYSAPGEGGLRMPATLTPALSR